MSYSIQGIAPQQAVYVSRSFDEMLAVMEDEDEKKEFMETLRKNNKPFHPILIFPKSKAESEDVAFKIGAYAMGPFLIPDNVDLTPIHKKNSYQIAGTSSAFIKLKKSKFKYPERIPCGTAIYLGGDESLSFYFTLEKPKKISYCGQFLQFLEYFPGHTPRNDDEYYIHAIIKFRVPIIPLKEYN